MFLQIIVSINALEKPLALNGFRSRFKFFCIVQFPWATTLGVSHLAGIVFFQSLIYILRAPIIISAMGFTLKNVCIKHAEGEGFEPPETQKASTVFKTAAFDHSAIPPFKIPYQKFS